MNSRLVSRLLLIALLTALLPSIGRAWPHRQGQKANVKFLATSTILRTTWGQNEDTYLAEVSFAPGETPVLARLIDAYANEAPPLSRSVLISSAGTELRVLRDVECDRPFGKILLRTAPGDLLAILPGKTNYQPIEGGNTDLKSVLACYRIVRR